MSGLGSKVMSIEFQWFNKWQWLVCVLGSDGGGGVLLELKASCTCFDASQELC